MNPVSRRASRPRSPIRSATAWRPPSAKKSRTARPRPLAADGAPKAASYSRSEPTATGVSTGPAGALPAKATIAVGAGTIGRGPGDWLLDRRHGEVCAGRRDKAMAAGARYGRGDVPPVRTACRGDRRRRHVLAARRAVLARPPEPRQPRRVRARHLLRRGRGEPPPPSRARGRGRGVRPQGAREARRHVPRPRPLRRHRRDQRGQHPPVHARRPGVRPQRRRRLARLARRAARRRPCPCRRRDRLGARVRAHHPGDRRARRRHPRRDRRRHDRARRARRALQHQLPARDARGALGAALSGAQRAVPARALCGRPAGRPPARRVQRLRHPARALAGGRRPPGRGRRERADGRGPGLAAGRAGRARPHRRRPHRHPRADPAGPAAPPDGAQRARGRVAGAGARARGSPPGTPGPTPCPAGRRRWWRGRPRRR